MSTNLSKPRLAVAVIARDDEEAVSNTLASVKDIAEQLVVVDTGSQDKTAAAVAQGAIVVQQPWTDDHSAARNAVWARVSAEWILWLEAGERVTRQDAEAIRAWVNEGADNDRAYAMLVTIPPAAGSIAGEQVLQVRLVPRRDDLRFVGRVRERLDESLAAAGVNVEAIVPRIHRDQRENDPLFKSQKARRELKLVELEIKEHGQTAQLLVALGESLTLLGDAAGAEASFRLALACGEPGSRSMRAAYYGLLSAQGDDAQARQRLLGVASAALEHFPLDAQLLCALGGYLQAENRLDLARRAYETALAHGQVDPWLWHVPAVDQLAGICLALVYQLEENDDAAQRILEELLARDPEAMRVRRHLIDLHVKRDRRREALAEFDRLPRDLPHREALRSAVRGACLAAKKNWIPALAYLQTAYEAGCRDPLCLRWFGVALVATGQIEMASPVLRSWHAAEPRNLEARKYADALDAGTLGSGPDAAGKTGQLLRLDPPAGLGAPLGPPTRLPQTHPPHRPETRAPGPGAAG